MSGDEARSVLAVGRPRTRGRRGLARTILERSLPPRVRYAAPAEDESEPGGLVQDALDAAGELIP